MPKRIPTSDPPPGAGVEEAAVEYVDKLEAYRRYIQEGFDAVARGEVYDWEDVKAEMRAKYGDHEA
ncbi:hypothetical protein [Phenylobacterium sp.]|uniref:hypothetical protein n=1 Tax=Phenylobacterium sp. TaxID=1871053 RepID=UPI0025E3B401|nr:hypothetical protein [Phenylobacterium sp.]MBX3486049.1 hypothetical protein [Phenylobacterium sp.]MCW5761119.1 hypothetical protein [Phenylobacterium sp.]